MRIYLLILFIIIFIKVNAQQNLVPNGSFEDVNYFPCFFWGTNSTIEFATSWNATQTLQFVSTPDLFSIDTCENEQYTPNNPFGTQIPESGNAYVGMVLLASFSDGVFGIESIYSNLDSVLIPENEYELCAYFSLPENYCLNSQKLSFAVTSDTLTQSSFNGLSLNDIFYFEDLEQCNHANWTQICTTFSPSQPGNILTLNVINNQAALLADTVLYNNGICEHPTEVITVYYYIDNVSLVNKGKNTNVKFERSTSKINVFPNPTDGFVTIDFGRNISGSLEVSNMLGQLLITENFKGTTILLDFSIFSPGIYPLRFVDEFGNMATEKLVVE